MGAEAGRVASPAPAASRAPVAGRRVVEVAPAHAGERLDRFLAALAGSRSQAEALIEAGLVLVDGRRQPKRHLVRPGERIEVDAPPPPSGEVEGPSAEFAVLHEDAHLLVVDKPAGLVVHPARGHWTGTLAQALAGRAAGGEDPWRAGIVHRLDRDTSGLLVVAKSDRVHRALKQLLAARRLRREYLALVDGLPESRTGTIEAPIGRHRRDRLLMSIESDEPREARTRFALERACARSSLLRVSLDTGRTHQIRVHMQAIGHPVIGDRQYGGVVRYGLRRQFLHAALLAFAHPATGEPLQVRSPLPADLRAALELAAAE
jgi:23S rRNA pseudouridine1911/1915/1917 synthase